MKSIKPMIVEWCLQSWRKLHEQKQFITFAWHMCCASFYNVNDPQKRLEAVEEVALEKLERLHIPATDEVESQEFDSDSEGESDHEEGEEQDELDVMTQRIFGTRRSERSSRTPQLFGYQLNSSQIDFAASSSE
jgi:hypothetical protein